MVCYQVNYCYDSQFGRTLGEFSNFETAQQFALSFVSRQYGRWCGYSNTDSKGRVDLWVQNSCWIEILKNI